MNDRKIVVGGNKDINTHEPKAPMFSAEEIAAMKAAASASGQDTSGLDNMAVAPTVNTADPIVQQPAPQPVQQIQQPIQQQIQQEAKSAQVPNEFLETEFEIPTETVVLPSGGIFYPGGQTQVVIKYLTAEAEDIIFSPELINSGKVLDVLLSEGIVNSYGLKTEDMLVADRNAIILELRKTGFGSDYEVGDQSCPSCSKKFTPTIDLDEVQYKAASEAPDSMGEYTVVLPVLKKTIKFRLLNGADEKLLSKTVSTTGKSKLKYNKMVTQRYLRQIMEVEGNRDKTYINKLIGFMPLKDSAFLREYIKRVEPGFDLNVTLECPHCGHIHDEEIVLNPVKLFYPDANF